VITIIKHHNRHLIGWPNRIIVRSKAICANSILLRQINSTKADQSPTSKYAYVPLWWHPKRVFRNTLEMIQISIVVGILRIHGTTGWWTVWALSGDQRIPHVFKARRGSIDVSYPHMEMDGIWLSESPNWVWQVCDSLSELIRTTGGSHSGRTVWAADRDCLGTSPRILASTCNAFGLCLCNPRVSGRGGSGPGRTSGMPRECTRITAKEEARSEGGCT